MNMHVNVTDVTTIRMDEDGMVQIPAGVLKKLGITPGHPVMIGYNDQDQVVLFQETAQERSDRLRRTVAEMARRYSTGQTTEEYMEMIRGPYEDRL